MRRVLEEDTAGARRSGKSEVDDDDFAAEVTRHANAMLRGVAPPARTPRKKALRRSVATTTDYARARHLTHRNRTGGRSTFFGFLVQVAAYNPTGLEILSPCLSPKTSASGLAFDAVFFRSALPLLSGNGSKCPITELPLRRRNCPIG